MAGTIMSRSAARRSSRRRSLAAMLAAAVALAACGDPTGPDSIVGRYTLQSANGSSMPYSWQPWGPNSYTRQLDSGYMDLRADGSYTMGLKIREGLVFGLPITSVYSGTYTAQPDGSQWFKDGTGIGFTGSIAGRWLNVNTGSWHPADDLSLFAFRK